jgi:hypothetical protein
MRSGVLDYGLRKKMRHVKKKVIEVSHWSCDFCGEEGDASYVNKCIICNRDTCGKCAKMYDIYGEDKLPHLQIKKRWCKYCFKLAAKKGILENCEEHRAIYIDEVETELDKFKEYVRKRLL